MNQQILLTSVVVSTSATPIPNLLARADTRAGAGPRNTGEPGAEADLDCLAVMLPRDADLSWRPETPQAI